MLWRLIVLVCLSCCTFLVGSFMQVSYRSIFSPRVQQCWKRCLSSQPTTDNSISNLSVKEQILLYKPSFPNMNDAQWDKIELLCHELIKWNEKVNLISRKDIHRIVESHMIPSLSLSLLNHPTTSSSILQMKKVIDVGTGGGFPGLPLAIACPNSHFTLIDSNNKKMKIVSELIDTLKLYNATVVCTRAEDFKSNIFGYDFIVGRAVASLPKFLSYTSHLLQSNAKSRGSNKEKQDIYQSGLLYLKGGDFGGELVEANITQYNLNPVQELIPNLTTDKKVLFIPSKEIYSFHQRVKNTSSK